MPRLGSNSPEACGDGCDSARPCRTVHARGDVLHRHRHRHGFAAIVLSGGYVEAGDTGRHRVTAGDVIFHHPFEGHLDRFDTKAAEVLVLPLADRALPPALGRIADPDAIARLIERDAEEARSALHAQLSLRDATIEDWPDALALGLIADPDLSLDHWARTAGLHPGSLARGFRQQFGLTPAAFRANVRAQRALRGIFSGTNSLAGAAADAGCADQAHMNRLILRVSGATPGALRRAAATPSAD